jgi:ABC-type dipeptide/oligopeptide/nickel transport system ATPase component
MFITPDFVVKYDPKTETQEDLSRRIWKVLVNKRMHGKKPTVIGVFGGSGEGKSHTALTIQKMTMENEGVEFKRYIEDINVYTPIQYPTKINKLLYDKSLKDVNCICMHEAREIISANNWRSFLNQAIGDVNAMSRVIKRLCIIIVSQSIRDISQNIRLTLTYYCTVNRGFGKRVSLKIYKIYVDESDLDNPKLKKRNIRGVVILPDGSRKLLFPTFEFKDIDKDIADIFDTADFEAKSHIFKNKIKKLIDEMKKEIGDTNERVDEVVKYIMSKGLFETFMETKGKKFKIKEEKQLMTAFDLNDDQIEQIKKKIYLLKNDMFMQEQIMQNENNNIEANINNDVENEYS